MLINLLKTSPTLTNVELPHGVSIAMIVARCQLANISTGKKTLQKAKVIWHLHPFVGWIKSITQPNLDHYIGFYMDPKAAIVMDETGRYLLVFLADNKLAEHTRQMSITNLINIVRVVKKSHLNTLRHPLEIRGYHNIEAQRYETNVPTRRRGYSVAAHHVGDERSPIYHHAYGEVRVMKHRTSEENHDHRTSRKYATEYCPRDYDQDEETYFREEADRRRGYDPDEVIRYLEKTMRGINKVATHPLEKEVQQHGDEVDRWRMEADRAREVATRRRDAEYQRRYEWIRRFHEDPRKIRLWMDMIGPY